MLIQFSHDAFEILQANATSFVIIKELKCAFNFLCWVPCKNSLGHCSRLSAFESLINVTTVLTDFRKILVFNDIMPSLVVVT